MNTILKDITSPAKEYKDTRFLNVAFSTFQDITFENCIFEKCNFSNADFSRTDIRESEFIQTKLVGVKFSKENFAFSANFTSCDLQYSDFIDLNLSEIQITKSNCKEMRIFKCSLKDAVFAENDFLSAVIQECNLTNCEFKGCENLVIDPERNKIKNTKVSMENGLDILNSLWDFRVGEWGSELEKKWNWVGIIRKYDIIDSRIQFVIISSL